MAIVTFWSSGKEETAKTLSIAAIATNMAIEHNYKILLLSTNYNDDTLETCFWDPKKIKKRFAALGLHNNVDLDSGMEGLTKAIINKKTSPEVITNYTKIIFKNRLEVLPSAKYAAFDDFKEKLESYKQIISLANQYYDVVMVDLNKGIENPYTRDIIEMSDLLIVTISQRMKVIDQTFDMINKEPLLHKKNFMYLVGRYDKFSKYNSKNIARYLGLKEEVATVPYNTLFFEACNEGEAADFFFKFRKINDMDRNAVFLKEVKKTTSEIVFRLQNLQMRM